MDRELTDYVVYGVGMRKFGIFLFFNRDLTRGRERGGVLVRVEIA